MPGGDPAGDLPQADRLSLARPVADGQRDRGVGQVAGVLPAPVIGAGDGGEFAGGQVGGRAFAPGEQVESGLGDVGEQGLGPAAPVKAHRDPPPVAQDLPQLREQPAQLAGQRLRRLGGHHEHGLPVLVGDPGLGGGRGGELQPGQVCLLDVPGAVVGAGMPVGIQEAEGRGPGIGVAAGQRHDQVRCLAGRGELAELAADRLDFRCPVQAQYPAQRRGRDPGGAFGPGLAGQGQEHQGQQRAGQPVVAVAEPAVDLPGALDQPGCLQGGQRQQQPGQRVPGARGEDRIGALAEQPPPGQRPLPVPGHRIGQHRQRLIRGRRLAVPLIRHAALIGVTVPGPSLAARPDPAQRGPDGERRHPGRRRDLPQRLAAGVQLGDPGCQPGCQLRRAFGPAVGWDQPGHPARGQGLVPPPDGGRVHSECLRHLAL